MARFPRVLAALALLPAAMAMAVADDGPRPKVEFRWAELMPVEGVTQGEGVHLSCTERKAYLHRAPVLTGRDVAAARVERRGGDEGGPALVVVELSPSAARTMAQSSGSYAGKPLVALVDGKIVAAVVVMARVEDLIPLGPFPGAETEEVVRSLGGT